VSRPWFDRSAFARPRPDDRRRDKPWFEAAAVVAWVGLLIALPPRPSSWVAVATGLPLVAFASWRRARCSGQTWRAYASRTADVHALALVLLYALGVQLADAHGITTDGVTYFAQLRSVIFDRDLDVAREFAYLGQPPRPTHVVPIGPVLVWLPLYALVTAVDGLGRLAGLWTAPADPVALGLGPPYVRAALLSSFAIGAAGVLALHGVLRTRFTRGVACATTLLIFGATPLYWYMVYEPSMTHAASFGFVALFVACAARWVPAGATRRQSLVLGMLIGLAFQARSQEALFAIFPAMLLLGRATAHREHVEHPRQPWHLGHPGHVALWAFLGALPWIVIQALHSHVLFTRYEYDLLGQGGYVNPLHSRWIDTLFSSWHGFLSWTPVAYIAVLGTFFYVRRDWRWAVSALVVLFLTAWVNGSTQDWAGGWSFGGRRFSSALVMLAPGLALTLEFLVRRPFVILTPLIVGALWWNYLLMVQYTAGMLPKDEPVSFGRIVRQQAELHTRAPYWYPFAFPANVWFAWREGLPVDKYDVLSPEIPRASIDLTFDRTVEKYLLSGWDVPGGDDWGPAWWIGGTPAELAVPLAPQGGPLRLVVKSRTRFEEPPVRASLALDINGVEVWRFDAGVPDASLATIDVPAGTARRVLRHGFNRLGLRSLGVARLDPSDPRPPGPLASRAGSHVWPVAVYSVQVQSLRQDAPH
jgi:hypothetical protein